MEKVIVLLKDGIVFNIIVGSSAAEMAILFNCEAIEETSETLPAHIGLGFVDGVFEQPPPLIENPDTPPTEEEQKQKENF
jgi:hypothetical protein